MSGDGAPNFIFQTIVLLHSSFFTNTFGIRAGTIAVLFLAGRQAGAVAIAVLFLAGQLAGAFADPVISGLFRYVFLSVFYKHRQVFR